MITLSKRLAASAAFVQTGSCVADVGCDHAYTSIYLIQNKIANHCIAMDINEGPLAKAKENIKRCHCEQKIEIRRSNGLCALRSKEADTVIISGMGGLLIQKILKTSAPLLAEVEHLILQPQSEIEGVRRYLHQIGFAIAEETMVLEDGKYYVSIHAMYQQNGTCERYTREIDYIFGKCLLERRDACLYSYLHNRKEKYEKILTVMNRLGKADSEEDYQKIQKMLAQIWDALGVMGDVVDEIGVEKY